MRRFPGGRPLPVSHLVLHAGAVPIPSAEPSRLFHAVVLMGCAMVPASGCVDSNRPAWLDQPHHCSAAELDAGLASTDACVPTDGWPPTK